MLARFVGLGIAFFVLNAVDGLAQSALPPNVQLLKGARFFGIESVAGEIEEKNCRFDAKSIRNAVINRIVPAGMSVIDEGKNGLFYFSTTVIPAETSRGCAAAIKISVYAVVKVRNLITDEDSGVSIAELHSDMYTITAPFLDFRDMATRAINRGVDNFLASWRVINAGAEFVRVAPTGPSQRQDENISFVQGRLKALGLYSGAVDGIYGPATRQAVLTYQKVRGLAESGNVDEATLSALRSP